MRTEQENQLIKKVHTPDPEHIKHLSDIFTKDAQHEMIKQLLYNYKQSTRPDNKHFEDDGAYADDSDMED